MEYFKLLDSLRQGLDIDQWREELFTIINGERESQIDMAGNDPYEFLEGLFVQTPNAAMARYLFGQALYEVLSNHPFDSGEVEHEHGYKAVRYLLRFILQYKNYNTARKTLSLLESLINRSITNGYFRTEQQREDFTKLLVYCIDIVGRYFPNGLTYRQADYSQQYNQFEPEMNLLWNYIRLCSLATKIQNEGVVSIALKYLITYGYKFANDEVSRFVQDRKLLTDTLGDFVRSSVPKNYETFVKAALNQDPRFVSEFLKRKGCREIAVSDKLVDGEYVKQWCFELPGNTRIKFESDMNAFLDAQERARKRERELRDETASRELREHIGNIAPIVI